MKSYTSFEKLKCWQSSRQLVKDIYKASGSSALNNDFALRNQIRRAAVSIMSNIAEGFGRNGNKEFIQALSIARGSAFEVQSQLYILFDIGIISEVEFNNLKTSAEICSNLINGLIKYLKNESSTDYKSSEEEIDYTITLFENGF